MRLARHADDVLPKSDLILLLTIEDALAALVSLPEVEANEPGTQAEEDQPEPEADDTSRNELAAKGE